MLPDKKIDSLDSHLEQFKLQDRGRQHDLNILLTEYSQLLNAYKVLKRAHEENITNAIARPVSAATSNLSAGARSKDSYVLMLVDGNDYIFNDEFISDKEEGGMRAARKLNDAIDKYLDQNAPKALSRRVIVRIYANVTNLSKQLGRLKLTGLEKRSVADFTAGFTRAMSLFDFIDTLDEEGTKFKIREQFKIASEDAACSHILFAACNDPAYLSQLLSYNGARDKITLVQGSKWNPEFHQFNFEVTQFPTVFSWSGIHSAPPADKSAPPTTAKSRAPVQQPVLKPASLALRKESWRRNDSASIAGSVSGHLSLVPTTGIESSRWRRNAPASVTESAFGDSSLEESNDLVEQEPGSTIWDSSPSHDQAQQNVANGPSEQDIVCKYFQKGFCRFESACRFQHVPPSLDGHGNGSQVSKPLLSPTVQSVSGTSSAQAPAASPQRSEIILKDRAGLSARLPQEPAPGFIALNKFSQRLDPYMPEPTKQEWQVYNSRFQKSKPCNAYQLERSCTALNCRFDHGVLDPEVLRVLQYLVKGIPCARKGACRKARCTHGHLCQDETCTKPKGSKRCKFKWDMHYTAEECQAETLVPAEEDENHTGTLIESEENGLNVDDLVPMEQVDLLW